MGLAAHLEVQTGRLGAAHLQIGKKYHYYEQLDEPARKVLESIKSALDPERPPEPDWALPCPFTSSAGSPLPPLGGDACCPPPPPPANRPSQVSSPSLMINRALCPARPCSWGSANRKAPKTQLKGRARSIRLSPRRRRALLSVKGVNLL